MSVDKNVRSHTSLSHFSSLTWQIAEASVRVERETVGAAVQHLHPGVGVVPGREGAVPRRGAASPPGRVGPRPGDLVPRRGAASPPGRVGPRPGDLVPRRGVASPPGRVGPRPGDLALVEAAAVPRRVGHHFPYDTGVSGWSTR